MAVKAKGTITVSTVSDGATGPQGPKGENGAGVEAITDFYMASSQATGVVAPSTPIGGRNVFPLRTFLKNISADYVEEPEGTYTLADIETNRDANWRIYSYPYYTWSVEPGEYIVSAKKVHGSASNFRIDFFLDNTQNVFSRFWTNDGPASSVITIPDTGRPGFRFNWNGTANGELEICEVKVERGTTSTPWSPCPEDLGWSTTIPETTGINKYLWTYQETRFTDGSIINSTAHIANVKEAGVKMVTNFYMASSKLTGISVPSGGRNFLMNSENGYVLTGTDNASNTTLKDRTVTAINDGRANGYAWIGSAFSIPPAQLFTKIGEQFTFSVDVKITGKFANIADCSIDTRRTSPSHVCNFEAGDPIYYNANDDGKWVRKSGTGTVSLVGSEYTSSIIGSGFNGAYAGSSIEFRHPKLERGPVATPWSLSPEELGWSTDIPEITPTNKYLWTYEETYLEDGTTINSPPHIIGSYGDTGNGISSIGEYYALSASSTAEPSSWLTTVPTMTATNRYLWNYERIVYTNGTTVNTAKRIIGVYGDKGQTGAAGAKGNDGETGKGANIIKNGFGEYLDTSYWHDGPIFVRGDCPDGYYGYFKRGMTDPYPFDPNSIYECSYYWRKSKNNTDDTKWSYFSIIPYDIDDNVISVKNILAYNTNLFYLSQDLNNGDTVVHFTNLANWRVDTSQTYQRGMIFFGYADSTGYVYPDGTYSRNSWTNVYSSNSSVNKTNNTITLSSPWNHGKFVTGTCVGQSCDGATYCYYGQRGSVSNTNWKRYLGTICANKNGYDSERRFAYTKTFRVLLNSSDANTADYSGIFIAKQTINSSIDEFYQSTSPTSLAGGSWSTTQPTWTEGKYIWKRTKITYCNDRVEYNPSANGDCVTIEVGGKNIFPIEKYFEERSVTYTKVSEGVYKIAAITGTSDPNYRVYSSRYSLNNDAGVYTISTKGITFGGTVFYYCLADSTGSTFYNSGDVSNGSVITQSLPANTKLYFNWSGSTNNNIVINKLKIEKGNKATDWTPAPEDVDNRLSKAESSIVKHDNEIALTVKKANVISSINQTAETIKIAANKITLQGATIADKFTCTNLTVNGNSKFTGEVYAKTLMSEESTIVYDGMMVFGGAVFDDVSGDKTDPMIQVLGRIRTETLTVGAEMDGSIPNGALRVNGAGIFSDGVYGRGSDTGLFTKGCVRGACGTYYNTDIAWSLGITPQYGITFDRSKGTEPTSQTWVKNVWRSDAYGNNYFFGQASSVSDKRLKIDKGMFDEEEAVTILRETPLVNFLYNEDVGGNKPVHNGIYAQDLRDILLKHAYGNKGYILIEPIERDREDLNYNIQYDLTLPEKDYQYSIDYSRFTIPLWKGWQYHDKELENVKSQLNSLWKENEELKDRITQLEQTATKDELSQDTKEDLIKENLIVKEEDQNEEQIADSV